MAMEFNIRPIVKKEFRQIGRDKRTLAVLLLIPALLLILYGYALNLDVNHLKMAVFDQEWSSASRTFAGSFAHSGYFDHVYSISDEAEIQGLIDRGEAVVVLVIPTYFSKDLEKGKDVKVQVIVDGSNSNTATTALGYINAIVRDYSNDRFLRQMERRGLRISLVPIDLRPRIWYNPELKTSTFLVPGLIGVILMITTVVSTALSVVREKERGTMEQIIVSPIKPVELIVGKTIPYFLISFVASILILIVGRVLFGVVVVGNPLLLALSLAIFLLGSLGVGLLVSTMAQTQQVAFMVAVTISMLPSFVLSGFVFPISSMPLAVQATTYLVSARYFLIALRGIILKGAGLSAYWEQLVFLAIFAFLMMFIATVRLRRELSPSGAHT
ncbi:MAG: ABC transporter permease [Bacteroidota bacterium]